MSQLTETITLDVDKVVIRKPEFQEFLDEVKLSQHVIIIVNENNGMIIINGNESYVNTSRKQIENKVNEYISSESIIELSIAKKNFLEQFGQKIINTIREQSGIDRAAIVKDKLMLSGNNSAIGKIKSYLEKTLYENSVSITYSMKQYLELQGKGHIWKEFSMKFRVGTSFEEMNPRNKHRRINKPNKNAPKQDDKDDDSEDDDDNNNSEFPDSDAADFMIDTFNTKNPNNVAQQPIAIALCSDSKVSLSSAISELQSYSLQTESWTITEDELKFILKQQNQGKPMKNKLSIRDQSVQIKFYFLQLAKNPLLHISIFYTRGVWHVKMSGFKSDVNAAVLKIKTYLNDVVHTEIQIPVSKTMAFFLKRKLSSDLDRLGSMNNIKIIHYSPSYRPDNAQEDESNYHCLKLIGPVSRIDLAQMNVQNFLEGLLEQEKDFPCDTWEISKNISQSIKTLLTKIKDSDDYEAVGFVKFYNAVIERRQTTPKVTVTVVGSNEETVDDVMQQCKNIHEGYVVWKPSSNEYQTLHNILLVQKRPDIARFQQEWGTNIRLENDTNTIIIPARSKIIADEIQEALQNIAAEKPNRMDSTSITIQIQPNIRRFIYRAIKPLLDEIKTQRVYVDSKDCKALTLRGRSQIIDSVKEKIDSIINDVKKQIVTSHLTLPFIESELMRANSYQIAQCIEKENNRIIRDVKIDAKNSKLNDDNERNNADAIILCVVNDRDQTMLVQKGDITKIRDVDAIVNAANGSLYHAGNVDKAIYDAAGPTLDQECRQLIAKNGGVAIPTGQAVKTTAGRLPYKSVIHAIGPQYADGNQQERSLLFSCILSSLRLAEQEGYNSVALPAINAATYGFPLQDCTNIVIRAVKQFFADFPQSHIRKVVLIDIDDAACNSFAREVVNDHTNTSTDNDDITNYTSPPLTAKWCWQDDNGEKIYDYNQTRQIEDAFQNYLQTRVPTTLQIYPDNLQLGVIVCYSIHFHSHIKQMLTDNPNVLNNRLECGYQMNTNSRVKRFIFRYPSKVQTSIASAVYHAQPLDKYHLRVQSEQDNWDILGMSNQEVEQTKKAIRNAIESAAVSESVTVCLDEDHDVHKTAITGIAMQQSVQVIFQQDLSGNLVSTLRGFKENVLQVKYQISLYVQDILRMKTDNDKLDIPEEWIDQEEPCILVSLTQNHLDFIRIEKRMKETMNNVKIVKIQRVQNLRMWNHYALRRRILEQELNNKPALEIEMELFHGTRATDPREIYDGEYGFDMTYCTSGLWGIGTYFAVNASYSCQNYSYQLSNGQRQVFLAQVLTGEVYDYKTKNDQTLRRPPKKNESTSGVRYNSVSGETGGSQVYIIYENRIAYPTFLITFTQ